MALASATDGGEADLNQARDNLTLRVPASRAPPSPPYLGSSRPRHRYQVFSSNDGDNGEAASGPSDGAAASAAAAPMELPAVDSKSATHGTVPLDGNQDRMMLIEGLKRALANAEEQYEPPVPGSGAEGATHGKQPSHMKKNRDSKVLGQASPGRAERPCHHFRATQRVLCEGAC